MDVVDRVGGAILQTCRWRNIFVISVPDVCVSLIVVLFAAHLLMALMKRILDYFRWVFHVCTDSRFTNVGDDCVYIAAE